jgi:hypothetical protein
MTKTAKFTDTEKTSILWSDGSGEITVPNDMGNRHRREIQEWVDDEGGVIEEVPEQTTEERRQERFEELAAIRWGVEVGGITVNGMAVRTDRETTSILTAARIEADNDPTFTVRWKLSSGTFVTLDAATIIALSVAVRQHIQAAFTNEETLSGLLTAATTIEQIDAVDLNAGW